MVDVKKLITGFLILAALGSSFSFLFSNFYPTSAISDSEANSVYGEPPPPPLTNAFVETAPTTTNELVNTAISADDGLPDPKDLQPTAPPGTLSYDLVQTALIEVMKKNPDGPADDGKGGTTISLPDANQLVDNYMNTSDGSKKIKIPDWDAEAEAAVKNLSINTNATAADEEGYRNTVRGIFIKYFGDGNLIHTLGLDSSNPDLGNLGGRVTGALAEAENIAEVPEKYAALHTAAIKVLIYQKNGVALVDDNAGSDPLKALIIAAAEGEKYKVAAAALTDELKKSNLLPSSVSEEKPGAVSRVLASVFGIKTAHAQYIDIFQIGYQPFWAVVWDAITGALQDIAKHILFNIVGNQVVNWVRGSGTPHFITNWKGFLKNSFNLAASAAISSLMNAGITVNGVPITCSSLRPLLNIALRPRGGFNAPVPDLSCTLDRVIGNIRGFYNNFRSGGSWQSGWISYNSLFQGQNNFWIGMADYSDFVKSRGADSQETSKNKGVAGKGFLSFEECPPGFTSGSGDASCIRIGVDPSDAGPNDFAEKIIKTPGASVADTLAGHLHLSKDAMQDPKSWTSLLIAFLGNIIDSAIQRGLSIL